ncbi:hypothetical protein B0H13DRAFT_1856295 [Mycena leptocephala]|nr:hypothetical protein B0H13DRAFT_1856295 [Mycena leptocephala]
MQSWDPDKATPTQVRAYRAHIVAEQYLGHLFFSLDNSEAWINLVAFQAYMNGSHESMAPSSRPSSRASSSFPRPASPENMSLIHLSRASSPIPVNHLDSSSVLSATLPGDDGIGDPVTSPPVPVDRAIPQPASVEEPSKLRKSRKRRGKAVEGIITRELVVDEKVTLTAAPKTWEVPRNRRVVYHLKLPKSESGSIKKLDTYIREEDQDSWRGSTGHITGEVFVSGFIDESDEKIWCRRAQLKCNGVDVCELTPPDIFADCERFEPDTEMMRDLWNHEIDANEREAASAGVIAFFFRTPTPLAHFACLTMPILSTYNVGNLKVSEDIEADAEVVCQFARADAAKPAEADVDMPNV